MEGNIENVYNRRGRNVNKRDAVCVSKDTGRVGPWTKSNINDKQMKGNDKQIKGDFACEKRGTDGFDSEWLAMGPDRRHGE